MCGIVGYIGTKRAAPILLEGLGALEYRGYDSAGLYIEGVGTIKRSGKVANLREAVPEDLAGTLGIAHTRWATHGAPTEANAHPHQDESGTVSVVHNGIIENYAELRSELEAKGVTFSSETDTESLAQLIGTYHTGGDPLSASVRQALARVHGTFGIAVTSTKEPGVLVVARKGSPLMLGITKDGYLIASDAAPLLPYTREVIYLDDGELCTLTRDSYQITTLLDAPVHKTVETLSFDLEAVQKQGYPHFMLKEIMEVPSVLENTLRGRINYETGSVHLGGLIDVREELKSAKRIIITGCGSAYYAGLLGEYLIEELAGIPVETEIASELRYKRPVWEAGTVLIAVSQSGETADTLEAVREAKRQGILALGVVNAVGSTIARETDAGVYNHAGPEIGVASTKAFVSQATVFVLIALLLAELKHGKPVHTDLTAELSRLPSHARTILENASVVEAAALAYHDRRDFLFIGRKFSYPIAFEGALKLKEISYAHAEGYGAGELKHGPLALIEEAVPTVALMPHDSVFEKTRSNVEEVRARGGSVIAVTDDPGAVAGLAAHTLPIPRTKEPLTPILLTIPLQLFAYYIAKARNLPIDMPRNLAKSVTVE